MNAVAPKLTLSLLLLPWIFATGCSTLTGANGRQAPPLSPQATVAVEIQPAGRKAQQKQIPVTQNMRLQDVVDASGARFGRKTVYVLRTSPKTGQKHKMAADIDDRTRKISLATDYAVYPGDAVVIAEDSSTIVDRMMSGLAGK